MSLQTTSEQHLPVARVEPRLPALLAFTLGAFLVFGTGLAASDTLHSAAHDSRHSFAFPCH
ncbi:MAG: CbtB-domain containing protein [Rhizobiales bacterium]|nr:CbtB-domain containing protein [Hyphomicrobiales bacterium]